MGRLKGIPPILSPELLHTLASMGHGDEIGEYIVQALSEKFLLSSWSWGTYTTPNNSP